MRSRESRLTRLETLEDELDPLAAAMQSEGISALLAAAKALPRRDPWTLPSVEEDDTGMGRLLREARQRRLRALLDAAPQPRQVGRN